MKNKAREFFSSRLGLVLAGIGMAVGTGNIWRFPRIAGKNGGLAFIIAWLLALFVWSIPLMMAEMVIGRESRKGPVGALRSFAGERFTFLGAWVAFVTLAIMFYYSVVAGWCLRYFSYFVVGMVPKDALAAASWWKAFTATPWQTILFHLMAMSIAGYVVSRGIQAGLEKANKVLLPALFIMLIGLVIRALTLPGSWEGVRFLFQLDPTDFLKAKTWLEAFSQSAWSTGAGWGLLLTFAVYSDVRESKPAADCTIIGFSNNVASILAALVVIPTVFALSSTGQAAENILSKGNTGLTFTSLASLFGNLTAGWLIGAIFFLALFFAALTSLISMVELGARMLIDFGLDRKKAVITIGIIGFFCGIPSAVYMNFFQQSRLGLGRWTLAVWPLHCHWCHHSLGIRLCRQDIPQRIDYRQAALVLCNYLHHSSHVFHSHWLVAATRGYVGNENSLVQSICSVFAWYGTRPMALGPRHTLCLEWG